MYLTQLKIDFKQRSARKYYASPQKMHAAIMRACSANNEPTTTEEGGRVLWRVDEGSYGTYLYVVSPSQPYTDSLERELGCEGCTARTANYSNFITKLSQGQTWRFRLTANPTKSIPNSGEARGKRVGHVTEKHQLDWLLKRAENNGFEIVPVDRDKQFKGEEKLPAVRIVSRQKLQFKKPDHGQTAFKVTMNRVTYEGVLRIVDVEKFKKTLVSGTGPSKAYGCGLLTLAPVR